MASQENGAQPSEAADGTKKDTTRDDGKGGSAKDQGQDAPAEEKKSNRLAAVIAKLGLDAPTLITMFK
jgi:hypothetical protein